MTAKKAGRPTNQQRVDAAQRAAREARDEAKTAQEEAAELRRQLREATATAPERKAERRVLKERTPFGGPRSKLQIPHHVEERFHREGFHLCWVNEEHLEDYKRGDYVHVERREINEADVGEMDLGHGNQDMGELVSRIVNPNRMPPGRGYLMKIPLDYYEQDQAALYDECDRTDEAIYGGVVENLPDDVTQKRDEHTMRVGSRR